MLDFGDCPNCRGSGYVWVIEDEEDFCSQCDGSGVVEIEVNEHADA